MLQTISEVIKQAHKATDDSPAVYVGTYKKYNEGSLYGMWVDISSFSDYEEFIEFCEELHSDEDDPEFMFQDYMNFPDSWYSECMGEEMINKIIEFSQLSDDDQEMWEAYAEAFGDYDADIEEVRDRFLGKWESEEEYAEYYINDCYSDLPEFALRYFDYEQFARDLFYDLTFWNGYVFD